MQHHHNPNGSPAPLRPTTAWTLGIAAAAGLLLILSAVGTGDEAMADQATAEHAAWLEGLAVGELRANQVLLDGLAECHRARPQPNRGAL